MKILKQQLEAALKKSQDTKRKEKVTAVGKVLLTNQITILEALLVLVSDYPETEKDPSPKTEAELAPELPPEPGEEQAEPPPPAEPPPVLQKPIPIEMHPVISSNVAKVGYDKNTNTMRVSFQNASTYDFHRVPENIYNTIRKAESVGSAINRMIQGKYQHKRWKPEQLLS